MKKLILSLAFVSFCSSLALAQTDEAYTRTLKKIDEGSIVTETVRALTNPGAE